MSSFLPFFLSPILPFLLSFLLLLSACERQDRRPAQVVDYSQEPDQETWAVHWVLHERDQPRVRIEANYMARYERQDSTYAQIEGGPDGEDQVRVTIYDAQGAESATVRANQLLYREDERRFTALGQVVVTTTTEKRLETETLRWYETEQRINAPGFVRLQTPDQLLQGYRLTGDETLDQFRIERITGNAVIEDDY